MEFKEIVMKRYATKKFDGRKIDQKKVDELLEMIRFSASSFGIQPYKIKVISDQKTKEMLAPASWNQAQITTCSHLLVFCANTDIKKHIALLEQAIIKNGAKKEDIKGYVESMYGFEKKLTEEQKLSWSQRQSFLALGNAINGAKSLGFDSCPMEGFSAEEYSRLLKLPKNIVPTALCTIGYAADIPLPKARMPQEELFF
jgi:nitroreductase